MALCGCVHGSVVHRVEWIDHHLFVQGRCLVQGVDGLLVGWNHQGHVLGPTRPAAEDFGKLQGDRRLDLYKSRSLCGGLGLHAPNPPNEPNQTEPNLHDHSRPFVRPLYLYCIPSPRRPWSPAAMRSSVNLPRPHQLVSSRRSEAASAGPLQC